MSRLVALIAAGLLLATAGVTRAGGFALAEQSTVAAGTGGSGTARADDPGAAWYNPAALADGGGLRVGIGIMAAMPALRAEAMDGSWATDSESAPATPPHLHVSHAVGKLAYGIAAGVPFGSGVTWPEDWAGRHEIVASRIEVFRVAPFVAWSFGRVRVAGGIHLDAARLRIHRGLDFVDTEGDVHLDLDATGVGVDAAVFVAARPDLDLGLSYKSRTALDLYGGADFEAPDAFQQKTADQHARAAMTLPDRVALGAAWRRDRLTVLADLEVLWWKVNEQLVIDFENEATPDAVQNNQWNTTLAVRAGAEYQLTPGWRLRGGAFVDPSPAPAESLAPSSPDSTRLGVSAGASRRFGDSWSGDLFYEYLHLIGRETANMDTIQARYGGHAQMLGIGVRYRR